MRHPLLSFALVAISFWLNGCQSESSHIALGTLEQDSLILNALVSQQIRSLPVEEGESVTTGQVLAEFEDDAAQAQLAYTKAQLLQAQAAFAEVKNGNRSEQIESAYAAWQGASANDKEAVLQLQRTQELYRANAIGRAALDNAAALRDQTKAQAEQLEQRWLELRNGARTEVLAQRQAQVEAVQAQLDLAQASLSHYRILAPAAGVIDSSPWHRGDSVLAGTQMFRLLSQEQPYARVYLPETMRARMPVGTEVEVVIEGFAQPFTGVVRTVRSKPAFTPYYALNEKERSRLMYLAEIEVSSAENVPIGTALEVHLP